MCLSRWHSLNTRGSMYTWSTVLPPVAVMGFCAGFTRWHMFYHALSPFNISNILESPPQLKLHTCLFLFSPLRSFIQRMNTSYILLDLKCFLELGSRFHDPTTPNFYMPAKLVLYGGQHVLLPTRDKTWIHALCLWCLVPSQLNQESIFKGSRDTVLEHSFYGHTSFEWINFLLFVCFFFYNFHTL